MQVELPEALVKKLTDLAKKSCWGDTDIEDFDIDDFAGGNQDDAYYGGQRTGEVELARLVLQELNVQF